MKKIQQINSLFEYTDTVDDRFKKFEEMEEEQKDLLTCDEVFCLYLRDVSKIVNERYFKQCLRFVLLYRECVNEFGWLKRSETYARAGMLQEDTLLLQLKKTEEE